MEGVFSASLGTSSRLGGAPSGYPVNLVVYRVYQSVLGSTLDLPVNMIYVYEHMPSV
jgi:hypothetical protein